MLLAIAKIVGILFLPFFMYFSYREHKRISRQLFEATETLKEIHNQLNNRD